MGIKLSNIRIFYAESSSPILSVHSLQFNAGINFLIGKNGSGKSTLLKALSNINTDIHLMGSIELDNQLLRRFQVGLVTQNPLQSINLELTFLENLVLANTRGYDHLSLKIQLNSEQIDTVFSFLQTFTNKIFLSKIITQQARNLSSGQQQILAILMRVIRYQKVLLLDECTANLDADNTKVIIDILLALAEKGTVIIFATHQMELLNTINSKIYTVENGTINKSY